MSILQQIMENSNQRLVKSKLEKSEKLREEKKKNAPDFSQPVTGEILKDSTKKGKQRPWKKHKELSILVAESYDRLSKNRHFGTARYLQILSEDGELDITRLKTPYDKRRDNVLNCSEWLNFDVCENGHHKLKSAEFCRGRVCPICSWRRSCRIADQVKKVAHRAKEKAKGRWIFLTLTMRNVPFEDLHKAIGHMLTSFSKRLVRYVNFKKAVHGYLRSLEVTRNLDKFSPSYNTFHPHLHVLLYVKSSYFYRYYIKQDEWTEMWKKALQIDYRPNVDVRIVKAKKISKDTKELMESIDLDDVSEDLTAGAIAETAKYSVKHSDLVVYKNTCYCQKECKCGNKKFGNFPDQLVDEEKTDFSIFAFDSILARRQLKAYGGLLREVFKELKLDDVDADDADLVGESENKSCTCEICQSALLEKVYRWIPGVNQYMG